MDQVWNIIFGAVVGALASVVVTAFAEARRRQSERDLRASSDRRTVYGRFLQAATLWRESAADLEGDPEPADWEKYWAARTPTLEAAIELSLIAAKPIAEAAGNAMDELLDVSWDYEVNGPDFLKAALWNKIKYIDSELAVVEKAARAEFAPPLPRPRRWARKRKPT
ncbi:MAG TPA: hypothetical protein VNF73_14130 [Candidatus Saccharimonadales bacterium]|nr:hypothetical protein [Candidatus Saccharimonadales bacterium]